MTTTFTQAFAIRDISTGLYWTGRTWRELRYAKEWAKQAAAARVACKVALSLGRSSKLAIMQTV